MIPLADIPVTPEALYSFTGIAALVLFIAEKIKTIFGKPKIPQPMETKEVDDPVKQSSYITHCRINREEHTRIERELGEDLKALEEKHYALAREVSAVQSTLEQNGARLVQIDQKQDRILENLSLKK